MKLLTTILLIFISISSSYGQIFTLQDTSFKSGDILISYDLIFKLDKATILPESFAFLDSLSSFLHKNKNLVIEISNHLEHEPPIEYSFSLTAKRAVTVEDYLISTGINSDRLIVNTAFKPLIKNPKTAEESIKNKRTEFKILKTDYSK